jgi:tetratricopeptide (TPR) repeat protein
MSSSARRSKAPLIRGMQESVELRSTGRMRASAPAWFVTAPGQQRGSILYIRSNMPSISFHPRWILGAVLFLASTCASVASNRNTEPKWIRISSAHFSILTDANEKKARETSLRLEQMRNIFSQLFLKNKLQLPQPLDVIALQSDEEYTRVAPLRKGQPLSAPGFFLAGDDRNYIVLDLAAEDSWRAVSRDYARLLLNFNYPPTQEWFDEGFAQYFSSLRLGDNQAQVGGDPTQSLPWNHVLPGQTFTELLGQPWLPMAELFTMRPGPAGYPPIFYAQSWIVMHYLLHQNKLSDAGAYFGLVQIRKVPVEQAIEQAFGMSAALFEQAVKDYFHSFTQSSPAQPKSGASSSSGQLSQFPPLGPLDVAGSVLDVVDTQAQALVAEMAVRLPEHRDQGVKSLETIIADPKSDNVIAHRALAWVRMERKEFDQAEEELARARELDSKDNWTRYYLALVKFRAAQSGQKPIEGISNMIQDLVFVVDKEPDFAEAHNMLALARLQGGGVHSATEAIKVAIQLSPRSEQYLLNLAQIDLAGKKWDDATALLERLKDSSNPQIAKTARKDLDDLPTLKKYGVLPQQNASKNAQLDPAAAVSSVPEHDADDAVSTKSESAPAEPAPDRRKVQFVRGRLIKVDCAQNPGAILTVRTNSRTLRLRTDNYKSLLLVGADEFSCDWIDRAVIANYKAGGKADGDLVSVEVQ